MTWLGFLGRRLSVLVLTIVAAPTLALTFFAVVDGTATGFGIPEFAWGYVRDTFWHRDLGFSPTYRTGVGEVMRDAIPVDVALLLGGIASGVVLGLAAGVYCATHANPVAHGMRAVAMFIMSTPPYWLGLMVLVFFAPGTGYVLEIPIVSELGGYRPLTEDPVRWLRSLWVPCLLVGLPLAAVVLRMAELHVREALQHDFVRTAQAKGLARRQIVRRHARPLAIPAVAALVGPTLPMIITNIALMESAFNLPGIFREIHDAASITDWPLISGMLIETAAIIALVNIAADIVQARVDPTVRIA